MATAIPSTERTLPTDRDLARLAATPKQRLLRWLDRAAAYEPAILPLVFVPILVVVMNRSLHPLMAAWGLQLLSGSGNLPLMAILDPSDRPDAVALYHPPLMDWIVRLFTAVIPTRSDLFWTPLSALTTAALVLAVAGLARQVGGGRLGLMAVALLVTDVPVIGLAGHPSPAALSNTLAVLAIWGGARHLKSTRRLASWSLLGAGLALGACGLLHGGLPLMALVVLTAYWLLLLIERRRQVPVRTIPGWRDWVAPPASLLLLAMTGFAVAGWWWLFMIGRHGLEVWSQASWQEPVFPGVAQTIGRADTVLDRTAFGLGFAAFPLAILGLCSLGTPRDAKSGGTFGRRLLAVWLTVATIHWIWLRTTSRLSLPELELGLIFTRLPWLLMAAVGGLAICDRKVPNAAIQISLAMWAGLAAADRLAIEAIAPTPGVALPSWFLASAMATLAVSLAMLIVLHARGWDGEARRLLVWNGLLCVIALASVTTAWRAFATRVSDDSEWRQLRSQLAAIAPPDRCILVMLQKANSRPIETPVELRFVVKSVWPQLLPSETQSWTTAAGLAARGAGESGQTVLIACGPRGLGKFPGTGLVLRPIAAPSIPPGWEIAAFTIAP
jgi:hypothetical protein